MSSPQLTWSYFLELTFPWLHPPNPVISYSTCGPDTPRATHDIYPSVIRRPHGRFKSIFIEMLLHAPLHCSQWTPSNIRMSLDCCNVGSAVLTFLTLRIFRLHVLYMEIKSTFEINVVSQSMLYTSILSYIIVLYFNLSQLSFDTTERLYHLVHFPSIAVVVIMK